MQAQNNPSTARICPRGATLYIWQTGDTLDSVAASNGITTQSLNLFNPDVNFTSITAGTSVCIPPTQLSCIGGTLYEVASGDTFQSIAEGFGISTLELAERNPTVQESNLVIGEILCVPKKETTDESTDEGTTGGETTPGISCPVGYKPKTIQKGQTYADLLVDSNVSYRAMRAANPDIRPGRMIAGTQFCAPPYGTRQVCGRSYKSYTIQPGETLDTLATALNTTRGRLLMANPTLVPTDFSSGTVICVPD